MGVLHNYRYQPNFLPKTALPTLVIYGNLYLTDDFKPASVDLSQNGRIEVQENNEIEVTLPSSIKKGNIVYTGSKKPALKECVLIYDPVTDEFTLEKVASQCYIKKTRYIDHLKVLFP